MSSSTDQATHGKNAAGNGTGPRTPMGEDAMLDALQGFQQGLENLRTLHQERAAQGAKLAEREAELAREFQRLAGFEGELKKNRGEIETLRASVEQSRRDIEQSRREVEESRQEIEGSRAELGTLAAQLTSRETDLNKTKESLEKTRESLESKAGALESAMAELAKRESAAAARGAEQDTLKTRIAELERGIAEAKAALAAEQAKAADADVTMRRQFEAAMQSRGDASKSAASAKAEEALRAELESAKNRIASQQTAIEENTKALVAEKADKQRLAKELATAQTAPSKGGSEGERSKLEKAARALIELRTERDETLAQSQKLRKELEAARKAGAAAAKTTGHNDALVELRRSRLKRYRQLVREQSQKVLKATDSLKSRFEHAEKLNAQREQLAEASEKIKIAQRKIEGQRSKSRAAATMFYALGSSMVLAVMAWMVSGYVAPGTYIASAVVSAQGRGRTLNAAELGEWQGFHLQLINDPRFHEVVAERMNRRGLTTLGTPGAVRELVTGNVNTRSVEDGELVVELRGDDGPEKAARVLDTLSTALASHANAARAQRVDGAVTIIKQASQAGEQPIDNTRFFWAGGVWLLSLTLSGVAGWLIWKRMSNVKVSFEKSANADEFMDESKWVAPAMATQMRRDRRMLP